MTIASPSFAARAAGLVSLAIAAIVAPGAGFAGAPGAEQASAAGRIFLSTDIAHPLKLDDAVYSVVIGNPAIADVSVRDDKFLFLHGRAPGETNLLIYNEGGELLLERMLTVTDSDRYLTLHKGRVVGANTFARQHYNCTPRCERVLRVDSTAGEAADVAGSITTFNSARTAGASGTAGQSTVSEQQEDEGGDARLRLRQ